MTIFDPSELLDTDDRALVLAFQRGETGAYEAIQQRHEARVRGVCRRILMDNSDAQEASQETFLRVYQALGRFNGRYQLGAWISRIATNVCLDQIRSKGRGPSRIEQLDGLEGLLAQTDDLEPETAVIRNAESRRVRSVLRSLPPLHRAAIVLREFEGLSYAEIASALDLSEAQVKALLHRARQGFKRSWLSTVASVFIPARWLQRMRALETSSVEHIAQGGVTSAPAVTSCTTMLQHCGQVLADKVMPVAAALVIGATGGAVATSSASDVPERPSNTAASRTLIEAARSRPDTKATEPDVKPRQEREVAAPATTPQPEASPDPSPSPEATPSETETEEEAGHQPAEQPANSESPPPPPPFVPALGFSDAGGRTSSVGAHQFSVTCDEATLWQFLSATFWHGESAYAAELELDADSADVDFDLRIFPDGPRGMDVEYRGSGALTSLMENGAVADLRFSGSFADIDAPDAERRGLPRQGTFDLHIR